MTWQVSPEEWLLDFTVVPRGRSRGGESLDIIDDRLRAILSPAAAPAGVVIPAITATRTLRPAGIPILSSRAGASTTREAANPSTPAVVVPPGLSVELHAIPSPPAAAGMVIPSLTRPGPVDDEAEAIERLTPLGGTEIGVPRDDADDVVKSIVSPTKSDVQPMKLDLQPAKPVVLEQVQSEVEDEVDEALEVHEVVESKPADKPVSVPPPRPVVGSAPPPAPTSPPPSPPVVASPPRPPPVPVSEKSGPPRPPPAPEKPPPASPRRPPAQTQAPAHAHAPAPARVDNGVKKRRSWHEEVFGDYYGSITPIDADTSADLDVGFVHRCLDLSSGLTLLDIGCGDGRHALAFARLGLDVTGLDNSMPQLLRAARRNESSRFNFDLLHGDMRTLPRDRVYDVVSCLGTSFGYFDSDEQNRQSLQDMVEVLKPGGKLALQVLNRDYLMGVLPCRSWWQGRGCLVLDVADMSFFHGRIRVHRTVVFEDGRQFEHHISIRAYSVNELGRMLAQAGARVLEVSGSRDTRGRFYGAASPEVWIFARREDV